MSFLDKHKENLQIWLNDRIKENYGRDTSLIYYDVANYYFETDEQTDFLRKGVSKEHIEAHFLTCFVALTIARILENKLERKYSIGTILESLSKAKCSLIQQNYYLLDYYDEVLKDFERVTDIDFGRRIRTLGEIKKVLAKTKK